MGRIWRPDERPIIRIKAENGKWSKVRAERSEGLFAVHHDIRAINNFSVTHGLTGLAVLKGLTRDQALTAFQELNAYPQYWRFMEGDALPAEARAQVAELQQRFKPAAK